MLIAIVTYFSLFSQFWTHLQDCTKLLRIITSQEKMRNKVQCTLKFLVTTHLSLRGWAEVVKYTDEMVYDDDCKASTELISDGSVHLSSTLIYLWDGIIPLVTAFCNAYTRLKESGSSWRLYNSQLAYHRCYLKEFQDAVVCKNILLPYTIHNIVRKFSLAIK